MVRRGKRYTRPAVAYRILEITLPVFGIVLLSYLYGRWRPTDMSAANRLNLVLFIPALIFYALTERTGGDFAPGSAALGAAAVILGSGLLAWPVARLAGWQVRTLVPNAMFNNCGNLGIPLAVLAFGDGALAVAIVLLVTSTALQFTLGLWLFSGRLDLPGLARHPMVLATAAGVTAMALDWHAPAILLPGIEMLGEVAIPLMLVALGMRLATGGFGDWRIGLAGGLLAPATGLAVALPWVWLTDPGPGLAANLILFAALPPAVMNFMLADQFRQEPDAVAAIVAVGNVLALAVVPAVLWFLL
ncbi:putative permease [Salinisphaera sp. PC39]